MLHFLRTFFILAFTAGSVIGHAKPLITVHQTRSFREVPSIEIAFANGMKDSLILERFYPTKESRMARTPSCNFFGHLENENTACVSLTGCPGQDDLHFIINSKNSDQSNMYILKKDGELEIVKSTFKDPRINFETVRVKYDRKDGFTFHLNGKGDDELINDEQIAKEMEFEKKCALGECISMPAKQKMEIKIHYDSTFNANTKDSTTYLNDMVTHLQAHFCQISLGTQIHIEAIGGYTYHPDEIWKADSEYLQGPIREIGQGDNSGADLGVFMCKDTQEYGTVGIAAVGTMCHTTYGLNAGVNEKQSNVLATSEVVAHEMGHNMGMLHDFDEKHGGENGPCSGQGMMSYGSYPNVWSTCSKKDLLARYNEIVAEWNLVWCLDDYPSACGETPPGPTTPLPTTPPPTTEAPTANCETDAVSNCAAFKELGYCTGNKWGQRLCRKTCNSCVIYGIIWITIEDVTDKEFYFSKNKSNFDEAIQICGNEGGKVFEPRSRSITERVTSYTQTAGIESFWLGIHDKAIEKTFVYASDDSPIEWKNWSDGQPNNLNSGQDCAVVRNDWNGKWDDRQCNDQRSFVCVRHKLN